MIDRVCRALPLLALALLAASMAVDAVPGAWVQGVQRPFYFAVSVEDVDESVAWYRSAFDLELLDDSSDEDGRWRIANLKSDDLFVELIWDRDDAPSTAARGLAKVGFSVRDLDALADRVAASGTERPRILTFERHSIRLLQLLDPDGNIIQLSSPLAPE